MERELNISIVEGSSCGYMIKDLSSTDYTNKVCIEFIVSNGDLLYKDEFSITDSPNTFIYIHKDGLLNYYRLIIPTLEYYKDGESYNTNYHCFYFNGKIYRPTQSIVTIENIDYECEEVSDINDVWDLKDEDYNILYYSSKIFSVCNLKKCALYKIGDTLKEFYDNGCIKCNTDKYLTLYRNFIIASLYVLDWLVKNERYNEAQKIIDTIESCGDNICSSYSTNHSNDCNCGKS